MSLIYKYIKGIVANASVTSKDVDTRTKVGTSKADVDNLITSSSSRKKKAPPMVHQPHQQCTLEDAPKGKIEATIGTQSRLAQIHIPTRYQMKQDLINKVSEHSIPDSAGGDEYYDEWHKWQIKEEQIEREMENYLGTTNEHEWPWSFKGPLPDACSLARAFEEDDELFNTVHRCEKYDD